MRPNYLFNIIFFIHHLLSFSIFQQCFPSIDSHTHLFLSCSICGRQCFSQTSLSCLSFHAAISAKAHSHLTSYTLIFLLLTFTVYAIANSLAFSASVIITSFPLISCSDELFCLLVMGKNNVVFCNNHTSAYKYGIFYVIVAVIIGGP